MVRIAVLGAGGHSRRHHGPALRRCREQQPDRVELAAVCDLDPGKARTYADEFGFARVYQDLDRMIAEEKPDGIVAVTPIRLTEELVAHLLPMRIPLLIEKPPGETSGAARRLAGLAKQTRTPHMVSLNRRYSPAVRRAHAWLAEHAADRPPHLILGRMLRHNRREALFAAHTGIHLVDTVLSFLGPPERVTAHRLSGSTEGCYAFQARARFPSGAAALWVLSPEVGRVEETYEIHGPGYCLEIDAWEPGLRVFDGNEQVVSWQPPDDADPVLLTGALAETRAFIRSLCEGAGCGPSLGDAVTSMVVSEAIQAGEDVLVG